MSDSLQPPGLNGPRNSPGQNTGVGSRSPLLEIFPTQGSNPGLSLYRQVLYQLSHQGSLSDSGDTRLGWYLLILSLLRVIYLLHWVCASVQSLSHVRLSATPWTAARQASLSITNCQSLPKPMSIESVMPSNHLILRHPLLLLPSIFPSIRVFSNEPAFHIRWPKVLDFQLQHQSFQWTPRTDFL